jgi:hypothetical protein
MIAGGSATIYAKVSRAIVALDGHLTPSDADVNDLQTSKGGY